jgi:hypothetical protein
MPNQHYLVRYNNFISALKGQVVEGYSEKHHIIPKSMGGTDSSATAGKVAILSVANGSTGALNLSAEL